MKDETSERRRTLLWALPASLILHALIAALLIYRLPAPPEQPQEDPVNVALVPPPEPPKPAPTPPPPKPEADKPSEQKVEKPEPQKLPPDNVLKPVFQFGDKDTGPRKSLDGDSAQDQAPSPAKDNEPKPAAAPKDAESKPAPAPDAAEPAQPATADGKPEADKQEAGAPDADEEASAASAAAEDGGEIELPASAQAPQARPENVPKPRPAKGAKQSAGIAGAPVAKDSTTRSLAYSGLPGVRKLFSQGATGAMFATDAMADVPRDQRVAKLCASVLSQELRDAAYSPQLIPSIPLAAGNLLDAPDTAFRTATTWYHLRYRCGIDVNATRVTSFAFRVGAAASPEETVLLDRDARRQGFQVGAAR